MGAPLGAQMLMMKFSRNHEKDADAFGARLINANGYNPIEMVNFFEKLDKMYGGKQASGVAGWMSSHPPPENRMQLIQQEIQAVAGLDVVRRSRPGLQHRRNRTQALVADEGLHGRAFQGDAGHVPALAGVVLQLAQLRDQQGFDLALAVAATGAGLPPPVRRVSSGRRNEILARKALPRCRDLSGSRFPET